MNPVGQQKSSPRKKEHRVFQLLLRVAQRADELARMHPSSPSANRDRETWLRAEAELLDDAARTGVGST